MDEAIDSNKIGSDINDAEIKSCGVEVPARMCCIEVRLVSCWFESAVTGLNEASMIHLDFGTRQNVNGAIYEQTELIIKGISPKLER